MAGRINNLGYLRLTLAYSSTTATFIGNLPTNASIRTIDVNVVTAFNATGIDQVDIGTSATPEKFAANVDVSTAGKATVTHAAGGLGVQSTADPTAIYALYTPGSTDATSGSAEITITFTYDE